MKRLPISAVILFLVVGLTFFAGQYDQCYCQLNPGSGSCQQGGGGGGNDAICPGYNNGSGYPGGCSTTAPIGGGPGSPPAPTPTPVSPSFWNVYAGQYSYNDDCTQQIDPITMIMRNVGADVVAHVSHHGSLDEDSPTDPALQFDVGNHQHYFEVLTCVEGMVSQATKGDNCGALCFPVPFAPNSRWHIRCNINHATADPSGGTFAACTPHYDHATSCGHVVQDVFGDTWPGLNPSGSGFDAGRDYLYYLLVTVGGHHFDGVQYWGNDDVMMQCDGTLSGSNGYVNEIGP